MILMKEHVCKEMRLAVFFAMFFFVLFGCSEISPSIDEKFVAAYVEMRIIEQSYDQGASEAGLARKEVLKKYGYTRESFIQKSNEILNDEKRWLPFQQLVKDRVDSLVDPADYKARKLAEKKSAEKKKKDPRKKMSNKEKQ